MLFGIMDTSGLEGYNEKAAIVGYANVYIEFSILAAGATILLTQGICGNRKKKENNICCEAI